MILEIYTWRSSGENSNTSCKTFFRVIFGGIPEKFFFEKNIRIPGFGRICGIF